MYGGLVGGEGVGETGEEGGVSAGRRSISRGDPDS